MDPNVSPADLALITNFLRQKQFDQALVAVGRLEKKQPNSPLVYNLKGIVYLTKRDIASGAREFRARPADPAGLPSCDRQSCAARSAREKPDVARKRYDAVLEKDPKNEHGIAGACQSSAIARR